MRFIIALAIILTMDTVGRFAPQPSTVSPVLQGVCLLVSFILDMANWKPAPANKPKE